jgi:hypothetical protein
MQKTYKNFRRIAAWLSFIFVVIGFMGLSLVKGGELYFYYLGIDPNETLTGLQVIALMIVFLISTVLFFYTAVVIWLCLARLFFSKADVESIAYAGRHTRFDTWLINVFFRR